MSAARTASRVDPERDHREGPEPVLCFHPVLAELFSGLERRGVRWCLLRVPSQPAAPSGDIDLLVDPCDLPAAAQAAGEAGFLALPGWEGPPNAIFVQYHPGSGSWLVLDIHTELLFKSPRGFTLPGADAVLSRRQLVGEVALPEAGDRFWLLLAHCLLDKRELPERHRPTLRRLAADARHSPLAQVLTRAAGRAVTVQELLAAPEQARSETLARTLIAALDGHRGRPEAVRAAIRELALILRRPRLLRRRRGFTVALLGPNGVGKSTATANVRSAFPFESRTVYMGLWKAAGRGGPLGAAEIVLRPLRVWHGYLTATIHTLRGRLVIFDRYVYEAMLPARPPLLAAKRAYFWLLCHSVPAPDVALVLDVPGEVAYARKQENPAAELEFERGVYAAIAQRRRGVEKIDASCHAAAVSGEIAEIIWRKMAARWRGEGEPR